VLAATGDTFTLVLAVFGAVTGAIGTVVSVIAYRRDRPELRLVWQRVETKGIGAVRQWANVRLVVSNHGRQPTSIVDLGLTTHSRHAIGRFFTFLGTVFGRRVVLREWSALSEDSEPILMAPGESKAFVMPLPTSAEVGRRFLRMFVRDSRWQTHWAIGYLPKWAVRPTDEHSEQGADGDEPQKYVSFKV
jgi:hypothetical protein